MKPTKARSIALSLMLSAFLVLPACTDDGRDAENRPSISIEADDDAAQIVGGWTATARNDPQVTAAAEFAARSGAGVELAEIIAAQSQVVAGINYALTLELVDGSLWQAQVYQPLNGALELIAFDPA